MMESDRAQTREKAIRPAASLLIIRDGTNGLEVLTLKRSDSMRFLPGFLAFPGGTLDLEDWNMPPLWMTGSVHGQEQPDDGVYAIGGIRECAEEVGWLCALTSADGQTLDELLQVEEQNALLNNEAGLPEILGVRRAKVNLSALRFVGRWVTPTYMPARFDTRFFLYVVQTHDLSIRLLSSENEWVAWRQPLQLLTGIDNGEEQAVPPTIAMLKALSNQTSASSCFQQLTVPGPNPE